MPLALLLAGVPSVHAGYYSVTYEGGPAVNHDTGSEDYPSISLAYAPDSSGNYGFAGGIGCSWGVKSGPDNTYSATHGDANADTAITAHFTWIASYQGELPPKNAVVYQKAMAKYRQNNTMGQGDCTSDLPHEARVSFRNYYNGPVVGVMKTGYKYYVKVDPGYAFDAICTPAAHLAGDGVVGPPHQSGGGRVDVSYLAQAAPVELTLLGTTIAYADDNILIGQKCTAVISCGLATLTNRNWTIPGMIYGGFSVNYLPSGAIGSGGPVDLPTDLLTQDSPSWFWKENGYLMVEGSASAFAEGENIGQVTAQKRVLVQAPTSDIYFTVEANPRLLRSGLLGLFGADSPSGSAAPGMLAQAWAKTPYIFASTNGVGSIQFTQMASNDSHWTTNDGVTHQANRNSIFGLDDGGSNDWAMYGLNHTADGSWNAGDFLQVADSPNLNLAAIPNVVAGQKGFAASTWLMYIPPGWDSAWVPLWKFNWSFVANANGPVIPTNYLWDSWLPSVTGSSGHQGSFWLPNFPKWDVAISQIQGATPP